MVGICGRHGFGLGRPGLPGMSRRGFMEKKVGTLI